MQRIRHTPHGFGKCCATLLITVALVTLSGCGPSSLIPGSGTCSDATRKVIGEFPAYGNARLDVGDGAEAGCFASFETPASGADVIVYYRQKLMLHGWTTHDSAITPPMGEGEPPSSIPAGGVPGSTVSGVSGERDGYSYEISTEIGEGGSGVYVAINVVGPHD